MCFKVLIQLYLLCAFDVLSIKLKELIYSVKEIIFKESDIVLIKEMINNFNRQFVLTELYELSLSIYMYVGI